MVGHHRQWPITDDLATLRENIQRYARGAGLTGTRLDDLVIAANEAAINVLEHGGGTGTISMWHEAGTLAVDVVDEAGLLRPGAVPGERPPGQSDRGYGLWLMGVLCDDVNIEQVPGCSRIRLSIRLPAPGPDGSGSAEADDAADKAGEGAGGFGPAVAAPPALDDSAGRVR
ncbi:ATP-binding protein [Microbispora sp. ATCC PTA-5024]|uniref:ATP-binding protein n=1 Tax=Microbispora sp. ATCC PTA-5024 TaxID=316330 RepID=UPI0003DC97AE|nr:ATP-binding protein [Microbispora sp. ATCC PTA-5024]ETK35195.1 hypothetical protein MPTA5024_15435 [Microbispora sp. ATCC PTA-5024]